jgi:hypothetical protein
LFGAQFGMATGISGGEAETVLLKLRADQRSVFIPSIAFATIGIILVGLFLIILKLNSGTFIYTLDDPYIHLALSDQIRHGNYGVNAGLHAAPSSSILFPFLLVPAGGTFLHPYLPLILNSLALFMTVEIMRRFLLHLRLALDTFGTVALAASLVLMAFCFNMIGIVFTGLEHSLHIAAVAGIVYGLALFLDENRMPVWLPAIIVLAPLLRYEGLPLSLAALLVLALRGRWRTAAGAFACIVLSLAGFSAFLGKLGLPPLPSSILVKSMVGATAAGGKGASLFELVVKNAKDMYGDNIGFLMFLIWVAAVTLCLHEPLTKPQKWTSRGLISLVLACLITGHALGGRFGSQDRYEVYAVVGTALLGIYLGQGRIRGMLANRKDRVALMLGICLGLLPICSRYCETTALAPIAANNIYEQQLQMHRFVNDFYQAPVAVNDLGLVAYHNPNFVLDLVGLVSEKARLLRAAHSDSATYARFVSENGVRLAIIYDEWFLGQIPVNWEKVGSMALSRKDVSPAHNEVQFYATDAVTAAKVREELQAFRKTLPPQVALTVR